MRRSRAFALVLAWVGLIAALPGTVEPAFAADPYTLVSQATYAVRPTEHEIGVTVQLTLTNTTPDPPGRFSVFSEIKVAIHDAATDVSATDTEGTLDVSVAVEDGVNVATIDLREDLRFEDETGVELTYTLPDTDDPHQRVRSALVVFPAWSFGTSGEVRVEVPAGYEVRVDGDALADADGAFSSGPIDDPTQWLALVTAVRPADYTELEATVPLQGGTADLRVRSFSDDATWGERTLDVVSRALPLLEREIGLPYPRTGQLVLTEAVAPDASGFGEGSPGGNEILIGYDQPPFTALHQVAHAWLTPDLIEDRWIREGLASHVAAHVGAELDVEPPYDPAAEAQSRSAAAFPLATWSSTNDDVDTEAYGYAASWAVIDQVEASAGVDSLRAVLARVAASVGPYEVGDVDPEPPAEPGSPPIVPLTTRAFLDHLDAVSSGDPAPLFAERVLMPEDSALLEPRATARAAFDGLVSAAGSWGAPDPVRAAMAAWNFDQAQPQIEAAADWLVVRDALLADMESVGLAAPDRLRQAYTAYGGGPEATSELNAEREVVDEYRTALAEVNGERTFIQRVGLVGGPDPQAQLTLASGRFGDGDLRGALEAITEARRIVASAETGGIVRLASVVVLALVLAFAAVILFRRRASYTARA